MALHTALVVPSCSRRNRLRAAVLAITLLLLLPGAAAATPTSMEAVAGSPFAALSSPPTSVAFSPDDQFVAISSGGVSGSVAIRQVNQAGQLASTQGVVGPSRPGQVAFSPSGQWLAVLNENGTRLDTYQVDSSGYLTNGGSIALWGTAESISWQSDSFLAAALPNDDYVQVYAVDNAGSMTAASGASMTDPRQLAYDPSGNFLVATSEINGTIVLFSASGLGVLSAVSATSAPTFGTAPMGLGWSPDGQSLAATYDDDSVTNFAFVSNSGFSVQDTALLQSYGAPSDVAFSHAGDLIAVRGSTGIELFSVDGQDGSLTALAPVGQITSGKHGMAFAHTRYLLAATSVNLNSVAMYGEHVDVAPVASVQPSLSGSATVGATYTSTLGTWSPTPTSYDRQWQRCDAQGAGCADIAGATGSTYVTTGTDVGHTLKIQVTAHNNTASAVATSAASSVIVGGPQSPGLPTISGLRAYGETLSGQTGTWSGTGLITFAYAWKRCSSDGSGCSTVGTSTSYALGADDVGMKIALEVTGTDSTGSTTKTSTLTGIIAAGVSIVLIEGDGTIGSRYKLTPSSLSLTGLEVQWFDCDAGGSSCAPIAGATDREYVTTAQSNQRTIAVGLRRAPSVTWEMSAASEQLRTSDPGPDPTSPPSGGPGTGEPAPPAPDLAPVPDAPPSVLSPKPPAPTTPQPTLCKAGKTLKIRWVVRRSDKLRALTVTVNGRTTKVRDLKKRSISVRVSAGSPSATIITIRAKTAAGKTLGTRRIQMLCGGPKPPGYKRVKSLVLKPVRR